MLRNPKAPLHIHWPEYFFGADEPVKHLAKLIISFLVLFDPRARNRKIVWTVHNIVPHGGWKSKVDRWAFTRLRSRLSDVIVLAGGQRDELVAAYPDLAAIPIHEVPLGHAHHAEPRVEQPTPLRPVRFLQVGKIAPYKGQLEVIRGLRSHIADGRAHLTIVGAPVEPDYLSAVVAEAEGIDVEIRADYVDEAELLEIANGSHVAVGLQTAGLNSGVPTAMIPLGLPVLLSPSAQYDFFEDKVGTDWVKCIVDPTDPSPWDEVLEWATVDRDYPPSDPFDWSLIASHHKAIYSES